MGITSALSVNEADLKSVYLNAGAFWEVCRVIIRYTQRDGPYVYQLLDLTAGLAALTND